MYKYFFFILGNWTWKLCQDLPDIDNKSFEDWFARQLEKTPAIYDKSHPDHCQLQKYLLAFRVKIGNRYKDYTQYEK